MDANGNRWWGRRLVSSSFNAAKSRQGTVQSPTSRDEKSEAEEGMWY